MPDSEVANMNRIKVLINSRIAFYQALAFFTIMRQRNAFALFDHLNDLVKTEAQKTEIASEASPGHISMQGKDAIGMIGAVDSCSDLLDVVRFLAGNLGCITEMRQGY